MLITLSLLAVLILGVLVGLVWRGVVLIGDHRSLDRLAAQLETERRMAATTHTTLQAMRQIARDSWRAGDQ
jgi:hypothetical protein